MDQVLRQGQLMESISQHLQRQLQQHGCMLQDIVKTLCGQSNTPSMAPALPQGPAQPPASFSGEPHTCSHDAAGQEDIPTLLGLGMSTLSAPPGSSDHAFPHMLALQFLSGVRCPVPVELDGVSRPRVCSKQWSGVVPSNDAGRKRMSRLRSLWRRVFLVHAKATQPPGCEPGPCKDVDLRRTVIQAHMQGEMAPWWKSALACDRSFQLAATNDVEKFDGTNVTELAHMACTQDLGMSAAP